MEDQSGTKTDNEPDEIIPEIIPGTSRAYRSDKEWIIPKISEREVVRMMKAREPDYSSETDNPIPTIEVWTDEDSRSKPGS